MSLRKTKNQCIKVTRQVLVNSSSFLMEICITKISKRHSTLEKTQNLLLNLDLMYFYAIEEVGLIL